MLQPTRSATVPLATGKLQWLFSLAFFGLIGLVVLGPGLSGSDSALSGEGSSVRQTSYMIVTALALIATRPWLRPRALLSMPLPVVLALAICLASVTWSISPSITLRRLLLTAAVAWTICTLVSQLGYRQTVNLVRVTLIGLLLTNYVTVVLFPEIGIHQIGVAYERNLAGDWRGMMLHKNFAGAICAITVLFFLFDAQQLPRALRWAVVVAGAIFLYMSQSKTSVGMLACTVAIGYMFQLTDFRHRLFLIAVTTIAFLGLMVYANIYRYMLFQLATDPHTLTGRATIWSDLINYCSDHFWLGSGYGSFWNIGDASPIFQYSSDWVRDLTAGHNGYLDLACELGVPLAAVVVGVMLVWPFVRLVVSPHASGPTGALLLALLVFCAGHNMTETSLLERDMMLELLLVLTIALIWKITVSPSDAERLDVFGNRKAGTKRSSGASSRRSPFLRL